MVIVFRGSLKENLYLKSSWFMQDGAPSHTSHKSRRLIEQHFGARAVGKFLPVSWTPYSPDLTPADFWLWPTLKMIIFSKRKLPLTSISSLKRAITWGFYQLKKRDFSHLTAAVKRQIKQMHRN